MSTTSSPTADILPFQLPLCPALPQVIGNKDYTGFEIQLERIDGLLRSSGVEALFVRLSLDALRAEAREAGVELTDAHIARHREQSRLALRCEVLRELLICHLLALWICEVTHAPDTSRPPHSPPPVPVRTVRGAADAKAISCEQRNSWQPCAPPSCSRRLRSQRPERCPKMSTCPEAD